MPQTARRRRNSPAERDPDQLLNVPEACALLRVGRSWIFSEVRKGPNSQVPFVRIGRYIKFQRQALLDWLQKEQQGGAR